MGFSGLKAGVCREKTIAGYGIQIISKSFDILFISLTIIFDIEPLDS